MISKFTRKIAKRYLWAKKSEAFISIVSIFALIGVAVGVAVLNITMSIMTGFEQELQNKLVGSSHIYIGRVNGGISNYDKLIDRVQALQSIKGLSPYVQGQVMLSANGKSQGLLLKGIIKDSLTYKELQSYQTNQILLDSIFEPTVVESDINEQAFVSNILLGQELIRRLGVVSGEFVSALSPQVVSGPFGLAPRSKRFFVKGFYKAGLSGYEEALAYTDLNSAQNFFKLPNQITGLEISVNNPERAPAVKQTIISELREMGLFDYYVQDWTELNKGLWEAIKLEKRVYFIVLLLLIVLASFSIVTTLVMIVLEKRKDIAVLRTLGASASVIRNIFILMGTIIGFLGTIIGLILGYIACVLLDTYGFQLPENVFPTDTVPVVINLTNFMIVGISAFLICIMATIYPARKASSLKPSEILRYE